MLHWLSAFAFTQGVEIPIYFLLLRRIHKPLPAVLIAFGASLLTHPFVWFAFPKLARSLGWTYPQMSLAAELFAVAVEAAYMRRFGLSRPLLTAFGANLASVSLAFASRRLLGWP